MKIFYLLLCFFPLLSFGQKNKDFLVTSSGKTGFITYNAPNDIKGTLVIAVICRDGILFTADSRVSFVVDTVNEKKEIVKDVPYAYIDSFQKIYPFGYFQIAVSGKNPTVFSEWEEVISEYNKANKPYNTILETFSSFKKYLKSSLNLTDSLINRNFYLLAGYENSIPTVIGITADTMIVSHEISYRLFSNTSCMNYYRRNFPPTCGQNISVMEYIFEKASKDIISVGGPLHIIQINKDNTIKDLNEFDFKRFINFEYFKNEILGKRMKVIYLFPNSESHFKKIFLNLK